MKSINSLSPGFLSAWYRNQSNEVKAVVHKALRVFPLREDKLNLSKVEEQETSLTLIKL
jgi:hypothetical protein